jgi:hypothetical protein
MNSRLGAGVLLCVLGLLDLIWLVNLGIFRCTTLVGFLNRPYACTAELPMLWVFGPALLAVGVLLTVQAGSRVGAGALLVVLGVLALGLLLRVGLMDCGSFTDLLAYPVSCTSRFAVLWLAGPALLAAGILLIVRGASKKAGGGGPGEAPTGHG